MLKRLFILVISWVGFLSQCAAEEGLVGSWPLAEEEGIVINDVGPNQLHGVLLHPEWVVRCAGRSGKALEFGGINGSAPFIRIEGIKKYDFSKGMTVMCWYKVSPGQEYAHQGVIVGNGATGTPDGFRFLLHCRRILMGNGKLTNYAATTPGKHPLIEGVWVHLAATFDDDKTFQVFVDGELAGNSREISPPPMEPGINFLSIGSEFGYRPALASISDVKLYSRKLSSAEIIAAARME